MRMTEIALERLLKLENVVSLFELSHGIGAFKLRSYCVNLILREFDRLYVRTEFSSMNPDCMSYLKQFLPTKMKRQVKSFLSIINKCNFIKK